MKIENVRQERNFDLIWVFFVRSFDRSGGLLRQKYKDFRASKNHGGQNGGKMNSDIQRGEKNNNKFLFHAQGSTNSNPSSNRQ